MGKGIPPKVNFMKEILNLGHSNCIICIQLDSFCSTFNAVREKKQQRQKIGKGIPPKVNNVKEVLYLGH